MIIAALTVFAIVAFASAVPQLRPQQKRVAIRVDAHRRRS